MLNMLKKTTWEEIILRHGLIMQTLNKSKKWTLFIVGQKKLYEQDLEIHRPNWSGPWFINDFELQGQIILSCLIFFYN